MVSLWNVVISIKIPLLIQLYALSTFYFIISGPQRFNFVKEEEMWKNQKNEDLAKLLFKEIDLLWYTSLLCINIFISLKNEQNNSTKRVFTYNSRKIIQLFFNNERYVFKNKKKYQIISNKVFLR